MDSCEQLYPVRHRRYDEQIAREPLDERATRPHRHRGLLDT